MTIDVGNSLGALTAGCMLVRWNSASIPTAKGGEILVAIALLEPLAPPPAGVSLPLSLPIEPALIGFSVFLQTIEVDAGAQFGLSFIEGLELTFGQ